MIHHKVKPKTFKLKYQLLFLLYLFILIISNVIVFLRPDENSVIYIKGL